MSSKNRAVLAVAAVVLLGLGGYWVWTEQQKQAQERAIAAAIADTTVRLRDSLGIAPNATGKRALPRIDGHVSAVEQHLDRIRSADQLPALAQGAEHYVVSAHAILRRQAASIRQAEQSAASRAALISHMRRAARRDAGWIRDAMAQKKTVEGQYFDYGVTLTALAELLKSFPDARQRAAAHLDEQSLLEDGPAEVARGLVLKESKRAAEELDGVRRLAPR